MDRLELMRAFAAFEEFDEGDFTPAELEEYYARLSETAPPQDRKAAYFDFYDDVKDKSLKKQDW